MPTPRSWTADLPITSFEQTTDPERRRVERAGAYFVVEGILALERRLISPGVR